MRRAGTGVYLPEDHSCSSLASLVSSPSTRGAQGQRQLWERLLALESHEQAGRGCLKSPVWWAQMGPLSLGLTVN